MEARSKIVFFSLLCAALAFLLFAYTVFATEITLVGEVNDSNQLVANGQIYEVAETPVGDDLVQNYIAEKVSVTGTVEEQGEMKIITIKSFKIVPE
jgi:hypothetical protein